LVELVSGRSDLGPGFNLRGEFVRFGMNFLESKEERGLWLHSFSVLRARSKTAEKSHDEGLEKLTWKESEHDWEELAELAFFDLVDFESLYGLFIPFAGAFDGGDGDFVEGDEDAFGNFDGDGLLRDVVDDAVHPADRDDFVALGHGRDTGFLFLALLFLGADQEEVKHHDHKTDHDRSAAEDTTATCGSEKRK
jgi:hypothetical protein